MVAAGVTAASDFADELTRQLDTDEGGFRWWAGQTDQKRLILIGDYLIQSVQGVAESLLDAALSCEDHRAALFADNDWAVRRCTQVAMANADASNDDFLQALKREEREKNRDRRISMTADACLVYLVQCLDRCAAIIAIVAALDVDVKRVGWAQVLKLCEPGALAPKKQLRKSLNLLPGPEGLSIQESAVSVLARWPEFGPTDWLPWLLQTRNARAHRAHPTSWNLLMVSPRKSFTGLCRPFFRQPEISEMHSMTLIKPGSRDMGGHLLLEESTTILNGLATSTSCLAAEIIRTAKSLWHDRQASPAALIQSGRQWPMDTSDLTSFPGFGVPAPLQRDTKLHVHPSLAQRLLAARVMDSDAGFWTS